MNSQDIRVMRSKQFLIDALMQLLKVKKFNDITVTEVCKVAKINRSTFYVHFSNIDELFNDYFKVVIGELVHDYEGILQKLKILDTSSMVAFYEHILKHRPFYDVLLSENAPMQYLIQFQYYIKELPKQLILQHIQDEAIAEMYYAFCIGSTLGLLYQWKSSEYQKTPEEMSVLTMRFFRSQLKEIT